jgi:hypothetical protein
MSSLTRRRLIVMVDDSDPHATRHPAPTEPLVRHETDRLLEALDRLREAEERRREAPFSSEEFFARSRDVERQAREVFRLADLDDEGTGSGEESRPDGEESIGWPAPEAGEEPRD